MIKSLARSIGLVTLIFSGLFFSFVDHSSARHESQRESDGTIDGLPGYLPEECYIYDSAGNVFGVYPQRNCAQEQIPQQTSGSNISSGNISSSPNNYYNGTSSSQQNRINWGEICMNPLVDYVITEPCSTLTSADGYTLTPEGERVLRCLAGGALVGILQPELLVQIRELGPAVGCAG